MVSRQLGVGDESLRSWVKRAEIDVGLRAGMTSAKLAKLRKENRELRYANDIRLAGAHRAKAEHRRKSGTL